MAGVSTKDIKNRIRSMESTNQITKAMEMVAASKLRHAQAKVLSSRPYFEILYATIHDIVAHNNDFSSPYLAKRNGNKALYVVIAGDRGLAGGYNSNMLKMVVAHMEGKNAVILPVGKKAVEFFRHRKAELLTEQYADAADLNMGDCFTVSSPADLHSLSADGLTSCLTKKIAAIRRTPLSSHHPIHQPACICAHSSALSPVLWTSYPSASHCCQCCILSST